MGFAVQLTSGMISEFASRPFIRKALSNPCHPMSVLSFYFGIDCQSSEAASILRDGEILKTMSPFWFQGHEDYDALCRPFADTIRSAGRKKLPPFHNDGTTATITPSWDSIHGKIAQIILCDQLSRNCFRGTKEAFLYDETALELSRDLTKRALSKGEEEVKVKEEKKHAAADVATRHETLDKPTDDDEIYGSYANIMAFPLMHSENIQDHEMCLALLDWAKTQSPEIKDWWDNTRRFELDHKAVIDRFGRYPHRNKMKGRTSTDEETEWLANEDELPIWAKSQG